MQITYRTGDLLTAPEPAIVHGCNARGVMGSGVARLIRQQYPQAYKAYRDAYESERSLSPGQTIWVKCDPHIVINAITQDGYGRNGACHVDYNAVDAVMRRIDNVARLTQDPECERETIDAVGMPLIGAGLAGGSWATISRVIEDKARHFQPVVYLVDGRIPQD